MIIRNYKDLPEYDVKEAYGSDAQGVAIRWISDKRTGNDAYLHNFASDTSLSNQKGIWPLTVILGSKR